MERVKTGIKGLDSLIGGGFLPGSTVLIAGGTGTGKTTLCTQFILEGLKKGETCMFLTIEQRPKDLLKDLSGFKWDLQKYIDENKLIMEFRDPFQVAAVSSPVIGNIKDTVQRLVVDSTSILGMYYKDAFEVRKQLYKLLVNLKETGVTSMLTSELLETSPNFSRFGVEEFVTDAVVVLYNLRKENVRVRALEVLKVRGVQHETRLVPYEITEKGIVVYPEGKVY